MGLFDDVADQLAAAYQPAVPLWSPPRNNKRVLMRPGKRLRLCTEALPAAGKLSPSTHPSPPTGWATMGDLKTGDIVFDQYGQPTTVTNTTPVMTGRTCYLVTFDDGAEIVTRRRPPVGHTNRPRTPIEARSCPEWQAARREKRVGRGTGNSRTLPQQTPTGP